MYMCMCMYVPVPVPINDHAVDGQPSMGAGDVEAPGVEGGRGVVALGSLAMSTKEEADEVPEPQTVPGNSCPSPRSTLRLTTRCRHRFGHRLRLATRRRLRLERPTPS